MNRIDITMRTNNLDPNDVADALTDLATEFRSRNTMPDDEAGNVSLPDGRDIGFWETA